MLGVDYKCQQHPANHSADYINFPKRPEFCEHLRAASKEQNQSSRDSTVLARWAAQVISMQSSLMCAGSVEAW